MLYTLVKWIVVVVTDDKKVSLLHQGKKQFTTTKPKSTIGAFWSFLIIEIYCSDFREGVFNHYSEKGGNK